MSRPTKLERSPVDAWLQAHATWSREGDDAIVRRFTFADFGAAVAFAVRLGFAAEKRDHHPMVTLGWGYASVLWTTHDAGGLTQLDLDLAEITDGVAR